MWVPKLDRFVSDIIIAGRTQDPQGFVTEHRSLDGLHGPIPVVFSVTGLRQLAKRHPQVGLVPKVDLDNALMQVHALEVERDQMRDQRDALEHSVASYVEGFQQMLKREPPKRMGRPPVKREDK